MKNLIYLFALIAMPALAEVSYVRGGEAKILYSCDVLEGLPLEKEERETISFFEKGKQGLSDMGLVFRYIQGRSGDELTIKFRTQKNLVIDESIYQSLSASSRGELKCEEDVNYDPAQPKVTNSCSFKAPGNQFLPEHADLIRMVGLPQPNLENLRRVDVASTSWKYKLSNGQRGPLTKKPSVEVWRFRNTCILEISGKYQAPVRAEAVLGFLRGLIQMPPAPEQGNKTGLALGI